MAEWQGDIDARGRQIQPDPPQLDAWDRRYANLKTLDPKLYKRAIETASAIALNNSLDTKVAREIEQALVAMALSTYGMK